MIDREAEEEPDERRTNCETDRVLDRQTGKEAEGKKKAPSTCLFSPVYSAPRLQTLQKNRAKILFRLDNFVSRIRHLWPLETDRYDVYETTGCLRYSQHYMLQASFYISAAKEGLFVGASVLPPVSPSPEKSYRNGWKRLPSLLLGFPRLRGSPNHQQIFWWIYSCSNGYPKFSRVSQDYSEALT